MSIGLVFYLRVFSMCQSCKNTCDTFGKTGVQLDKSLRKFGQIQIDRGGGLKVAIFARHPLRMSPLRIKSFYLEIAQ